MSQLSSKFAALLSASRQTALLRCAKNLGINPNWLAAVMYFETGRTFNPAKRNPIGSVGLIQFTRDKAGVNYKTIGGIQYSLDTIGKMSFEEQMLLVEKYYKEAARGKKLKSFIDTYLVTFFPAALGKPDSFVFSTRNLSASLIAKQNPVFDRNKDNQIQKREVVEYFRGLYNKLGFDFDKDINISMGFTVPIAAIALFFYTAFTYFI